jgi:hypothetical protein
MPPRPDHSRIPENRNPTGVVTFVRRFAPPFAELVRTGAKLQTVCPYPWRTPKPGDRLILRTWVGKSQRTLRRATITSVTTIVLPPGLDNPELDDNFARAEGYNNLKHLLLHFKLPFRGLLIRWNPLQTPSFPPLPPGHPDYLDAPM